MPVGLKNRKVSQRHVTKPKKPQNPQNNQSITHYPYFDQQNQVIIFGKNPVICQKRKIYSAFCTKNAFDQLHKKIGDLGNGYFWKVLKIVEKSLIDRICGEAQNHQNVVIIASKSVFRTQFDLFLNLHQLSQDTCETKKLPKLLILDQLSDPQNVGAIVRSAVAFGFKHILFCSHNSAKETSSMIRSAAGMVEHAEFFTLSNLNDAIAKLKKLGYWCFGLDGEGKSDFQNLAEFSAVALLIGSEGEGLRKLVKQNCDFLLAIKTAPEVESLNASVAAAIAMHQFSIAQSKIAPNV